jgi:hypothetical protein
MLRQIKPLPTAKQISIFSLLLSHIDFALKEAPNGRPKYFIGKEDTLQPRVLAKPPTFSVAPTKTNYDLAKLIFNPKIASKHKKRHYK